jgi:hypothetical protein
VPALLLAAAAACSGSGSPAEVLEREELERALIAFSESAPADRELRLDEIRRLAPSSARVREVQQACLAAYESFFRALARLSEVKDQAARAEAEAARAGAGVPGADDALLRVRDEALAGTREVNAALDGAEALVDECTRRRAALARATGR